MAPFCFCAEFRQIFAQSDSDCDGRISMSEVNLVLRDIGVYATHEDMLRAAGDDASSNFSFIADSNSFQC